MRYQFKCLAIFQAKTRAKMFILNWPLASLVPSFSRPFDLETTEVTSGSKSLDFCDMSTLDSRARRGIRGKKSIPLAGGRTDKGKT